jgi:hypothetical protein
MEAHPSSGVTPGTSAGAPADGPVPAAYARLAGLGLVIDDYRTERHELDVSSGFRRVTTEIVLSGGGLEGRGEDVTYAAEDHDDYPLALALAGEWTLDGFSQHLGGLDLFPGRPPQQESFRDYRRWSFESAALDLALRQQKVSLGEALGRPYAPVRFVLSTRLDVKPWLAVDPTLEFKLDPTPEWDESLMQEIAATGRVRALDFKAFYEGSPVDNPPDPVQYRLVSETFPGTVLEDPALEGPAREVLRGEEGRFSFDAPIHSWDDVQAVTARVTVNRSSSASSTSSRRASGVCARCSTAWSGLRPPAWSSTAAASSSSASAATRSRRWPACSTRAAPTTWRRASTTAPRTRTSPAARSSLWGTRARGSGSPSRSEAHTRSAGHGQPGSLLCHGPRLRQAPPGHAKCYRR